MRALPMPGPRSVPNAQRRTHLIAVGLEGLRHLAGLERGEAREVGPCGAGQTRVTCASTLSSYVLHRLMALLLFAAETLVLGYLNGRSLPSALYWRVVDAVEARLLDGVSRVLDEALCSEIEEYATPPAPWSAESVLRLAWAREKSIREATTKMLHRT